MLTQIKLDQGFTVVELNPNLPSTLIVSLKINLFPGNPITASRFVINVRKFDFLLDPR